MSLVLVDISFWTIWETFPGCLYNSSKYFWISYMSVCPLLWLLPCWSQTYIGISPVPDEISVWIFFEIFLGCLYTGSKNAVSLLVGWLPCWNQTNIGISSILDGISFWLFLRYFWDVCTLATNDSEFQVYLSVCLFAYFLTKIGQRDISSSGWDLFRIFWRTS